MTPPGFIHCFLLQCIFLAILNNSFGIHSGIPSWVLPRFSYWIYSGIPLAQGFLQDSDKDSPWKSFWNSVNTFSRDFFIDSSQDSSRESCRKLFQNMSMNIFQISSVYSFRLLQGFLREFHQRLILRFFRVHQEFLLKFLRFFWGFLHYLLSRFPRKFLQWFLQGFVLGFIWSFL